MSGFCSKGSRIKSWISQDGRKKFWGVFLDPKGPTGRRQRYVANTEQVPLIARTHGVTTPRFSRRGTSYMRFPLPRTSQSCCNTCDKGPSHSNLQKKLPLEFTFSLIVLKLKMQGVLLWFGMVAIDLLNPLKKKKLAVAL